MSAFPDPAAFTVLATPGEEPAALSGLEWKVVTLALREAEDARCCNGKPARRLGLIGRALRAAARGITGARGPLPLADPRLETLRRFVCLLHGGHREAEKLARRLIDLGFTQSQVHAVATAVGRG